MRNDSHKWPPAQAIDSFNESFIDLGNASLKPIEMARQTMISGPNVLDQIDAPLVAWPTIIDEQRYALCLRRDRVLLVDGVERSGIERDSGWDQKNQQAISDVSDTYAVFDLSGPYALELLQRGAEISLQTPSNSVLRRLFGLDTIIYRAAKADQFRVHIEWARRQSLIDHLRSAASLV